MPRSINSVPPSASRIAGRVASRAANRVFWRGLLFSGIAVGGILSGTACYGDPSGDPIAERFCAELETFATQDSVAITDTWQQLIRLRDIAPSEIRDHLATMVDIFGEFIATQDTEQAANRLSQRNEEMSTSATALQEYSMDRCELNLERIILQP